MAEPKHTPGPWKATEYDCHIEIETPGGESIAVIEWMFRRGNGPENVANANLIVRAVNNYAGLLELARLARDVVDDELENRPARHSLGNLHARLTAAIERATGPA